MPFVSRKQQRWGNSPAGTKALGGKKRVKEWNDSTAEKEIPEKVTPLREADFRQRLQVRLRTILSW